MDLEIMKQENFKKQFKKGLLELGILKLLTESDHYGYSIIKEINTRSNNTLDLRDGTLYPILYRLEDQKIIESYWETQEGRGKPRKYYKITEIGKERYVNMLEDFNLVTGGINSIINQ
jgi:PadR family transcriptional regulator PadR